MEWAGIPLGDKANLSLSGAFEKFLAELVSTGMSTLSKTEENVCALIREEYLFTGLDKGCGFVNLGIQEKKHSILYDHSTSIKSINYFITNEHFSTFIWKWQDYFQPITERAFLIFTGLVSTEFRYHFFQRHYFLGIKLTFINYFCNWLR